DACCLELREILQLLGSDVQLGNGDLFASEQPQIRDLRTLFCFHHVVSFSYPSSRLLRAEALIRRVSARGSHVRISGVDEESTGCLHGGAWLLWGRPLHTAYRIGSDVTSRPHAKHLEKYRGSRSHKATLALQVGN